ncbi:hypothetical protein L5515_015903 [Caenorhabditis briggsae]|uniref:Rap-GAP domain-containing protein n=1 Tax=Caenorhabditis briggsae TaxID=6238 RepID=A0AAE9EH27_CAEBR|nr:hypothetical protein L5515_015903 [Caenorhabditis briggsae]
MNYDEQILTNMNKFGIVCQKGGQTTEEQLFGNPQGSPASAEFLKTSLVRSRLSDNEVLIEDGTADINRDLLKQNETNRR